MIPAERWTPTLLTLLFANVGILVLAAAMGRLRLVALGAACFVATVSVIAVVANIRHWAEPGAEVSTARSNAALAANVRLAALAWLWGGAAMQAVYLTPVTGLRWQHAWQYAVAMLLLAGVALAFARGLEHGDEALRDRLAGLAVPLAIAQGFGGALGVVFLVATGKLFTWRPDWAANQIFLFGALLLTVLAAVTLRTHARLRG